jgi:N-acyl amino acid synthase of PEP-CTERM/exosortase system
VGSMRYPLSENFLSFFDVEFVTSEAQLREVYGIRYRVYCEEFGYESAEAFPDQQEKDEYDSTSLHALIRHKSSGLPAACVRMVSTEGTPESSPLPFEKNCSETLDNEFIDGLSLDRSTVCEISRLAVDTQFRRRPGEGETRYGVVEGLDCSLQERRTFSLIAVTCFLASTALTDLSGRRNVFAMMEPFLPRLLKRSGIEFTRIGEDIDYHGIRAPYFVKTESAIENMRPDLRELYGAVYATIQRSFNP